MPADEGERPQLLFGAETELKRQGREDDRRVHVGRVIGGVDGDRIACEDFLRRGRSDVRLREELLPRAQAMGDGRAECDPDFFGNSDTRTARASRRVRSRKEVAGPGSGYVRQR